MTKTKIVATIGPASNSEQVVEALIASGMDCARLNLSHGTHKNHSDMIATLKRAREKFNRPLSIIADTKGPEVRISPISGDPIDLTEGQEVNLVFTRESTGSTEIFVDYPGVGDELNRGTEMLVGDGEVALSVTSISEDRITCRVSNSGRLTGRKNLTVPGRSFSLPSVTERDKEDLEFVVDEEVDWLAVSFVRTAKDIKNVRSFIKSVTSGGEVPIIAKIETSEAARNIEYVADEADGLMVARGDLAMAIGIEEVPFLQKKIIRLANQLAKPVVTATQMLETMIESPTPTRAEITDVANAVLDGTDAVMLSGETAIGSYPAKTVATMNKLAGKADQHSSHTFEQDDYITNKERIAPEIGRAACSMADRLNARAIVTSTNSGYTARLIARFRPKVQILAVTPSLATYNQLSLVWGVTPLLMEATRNTDEMIEKSTETAKNAGLVEDGDLLVTTAGVPFAVEGTTNLIKVNRA